MQFVQNNSGVSESRQAWKPIAKSSYLAKLNNFAAENATEYSYSNQNASYGNQQQAWTPNMEFNNNGYNQYPKMNTWNSA